MARLTNDRLADLQARVLAGQGLPRAEALSLVNELAEADKQLAALRSEHADAAFWRSAFERLQRDSGREVRDRLDRITSAATR